MSRLSASAIADNCLVDGVFDGDILCVCARYTCALAHSRLDDLREYRFHHERR
jgi:hypothetical protein